MQTKKIRRDRIHRKRYILTSFGIAGAVTAIGTATSNQMTAHADTVQNQGQVQGVKQYPDKEIIDRTVDHAKGQEGLNIHQTGDQTLPAKNQADAHKQATDEYNKQSQAVNQAKDQAKQQMDAYHQDHNNWNQEKQKFEQDTDKYNKDLAKYNQDKAANEQKNKEIDNNNAEIDRENEAANAKYQQALDKYNQAQSATDAHNAQIDKDNAAAQQKYQSDLADYQSKLADYMAKWGSSPTIASGSGTKLVGTLGTPGSINYYKNLGVLTDQVGKTVITDASWHDDSQIIGASGKADFGPKDLSYKDLDGTTKWVNHYETVYDADPNNMYDITNAIHNNGTVTITNFGVDQYGIKYDLKLTFKNTDNASQSGIYFPSKVFMGHANDGSIEFDFYGGFARKNGDGVNISNLQFVYHGTDIPVDTLIGTMYADLDMNQQFDTNLGNLIAYTPSNSHVSISGDHFESVRDQDVPDQWHPGARNYYSAWNGFNSAPSGTALTVGTGTSYYYHFRNATDPSVQKYNSNDVGNAAGSEGGIQFNLFGKAATLVMPPTKPLPPSLEQKSKNNIPKPSPSQDKPHQEHIPFTETPPVPPKPLRPEPQTPKPVDVDYHYVVYDYNSNVHKDFTNKAGGVTNNQFYIDGSTIYAQITGELPDSRQMSKDQPLTAFEVRDDGSQYASKAKFAGADILIDGQNHNGDFAVTDRGNNVITFTLKNLSLAQGQKFVVIPRWTVSADAQPGDITNVAHVVTNGQDQGSVPVTEHNYKPTIHKDVLSGVSDADKGASIDGQTVANGTVVTFPLTFNEPLPANRAQKIDSTIWNDQLDPHFQYQSYRAFINQNGKKLDVTSHVHLTQNGQQLTWQDDDFLHNYLNNHMGEAVTMPWIDLTVKAVGDNVQLIPNQFDITQVVEDPSGKVDVKTSSNIVHISTYQPKTHKDVELGEVDGDTPASIDGQTVIAGSTITYPMTVTDLPANRSQNVAKSEWTDTLDPNVEYVGYKAFLPGADGSLTDVSSNIHVTQSGQVLTITDDDDLRAKLNGDKSQAQKQVIIDVYVRVKNTHQVIPNVFTFKQTFDDPDGGNPTETTDTSNKVTVDVYQAQPVKDVQVGTVTGSDSTKSVNGKLIPTGQTVTFPLTIKDPLPAHRVQKVTKTAWRDTLDQNLKYNGFAASIKLPNGQTVNLKDHIHVEQVGRTLIFTADDYFNGLMNLDLNLKQELPVIDVYATMTGTAKEAKNVYTFEQTYTDGNGHVTTKEESNVVTVHTPAKPQPAKTVTDAAGHNINGQETKAGVNYQYHLDWDLTKYQKIVASPEMIKKGFFFIDPINTKAIMLGDLSKATVTDMSGHVVPGMTIRKYTSISQLPKYIQDQIRENHLENQLGDEFLMAIANDPQQFYTNYVQKGARLKVNFPYQVRPGFVGKYSNTAYQFGFGIATPTNTVTNYVKPVPKPAPAPTPAPAPAPQQARLPQTGNTSSMMPVYFGLTALVSALGYGLLEVLKMIGLM